MIGTTSLIIVQENVDTFELVSNNSCIIMNKNEIQQALLYYNGDLRP